MEYRGFDTRDCPWCLDTCAAEQPCRGSRWHCARFMLLAVAGRRHMPKDLRPMQMTRAIDIVRKLAA